MARHENDTNPSDTQFSGLPKSENVRHDIPGPPANLAPPEVPSARQDFIQAGQDCPVVLAWSDKFVLRCFVRLFAAYGIGGAKEKIRDITIESLDPADIKTSIPAENVGRAVGGILTLSGEVVSGSISIARYEERSLVVNKPVVFEESSREQAEGESITARPQGGEEPYSYSSSDPSVGRVDETSGTVTPEKIGTCTITAQDRYGFTASYELIVRKKLTIGEASTLLIKGSKREITAEGGFPPYEYTSSEPLKASVGKKDGIVTGVAEGTAIIKVKDTREAERSIEIVVAERMRAEPSKSVETVLAGFPSFPHRIKILGGTPPFSFTSDVAGIKVEFKPSEPRTAIIDTGVKHAQVTFTDAHGQTASADLSYEMDGFPTDPNPRP